MDIGLTCFLLRSLPTRATGLKLKLRILKVKDHLVTFNEDDNPAATIMSHGLFLARPTPTGVKDPLLLGVLNQPELRDQDSQNHFGVFWNARMFDAPSKMPVEVSALPEDSLGKRAPKIETEFETENGYWKHSISLIRNGIIKIMPPSLISDLAVTNQIKKISKESCFKNFAVQTTPNARVPELHHELLELEKDSRIILTPSRPYPVPPSLLFLTIMQHYHKIHLETTETTKSHSKIVPEGEAEPATTTPKDPMWFLEPTLAAVEASMVSLYSTLEYLKGFLLPKNPADLKAYESVARNTQQELRQLTVFVLALLLDPFCDTLSNLSARSVIDLSKVRLASCEKILKAKSTVTKLYTMSQTDFSKVSLSDLGEKLRGVLSNYTIVSTIKNCWKIDTFRQGFFAKIEKLLGHTRVNHRMAQEVLAHLIKGDIMLTKGHLYSLQELYFTKEFVRVGDYFLNNICDHKFCCLKSAKSNQAVRFNPGQFFGKEWILVAVITSNEIKICIVTEKFMLDEAVYDDDTWMTTPDTITYVKVYDYDSEIACFATDATVIMGHERCNFNITQYFTGRYFIRFEEHFEEPSELFLLDLGSCIQPEPEPPAMHLKKLSEFLILPEMMLEYSFTNNFFSFLAVDPSSLDKAGKRTNIPSTLGIIRFGGPEGLSMMKPIPCRHLFEEINQHSDDYNLYQRYSGPNQICWNSNLRRLFYTNWGYGEVHSFINPPKTKRLLIACFEVDKSLESMTTLDYRDFQLCHLMKADDLKQMEPQFSTFSMRGLEYLVMDLMKKPDPRYDEDNALRIILARVLFKVHRRRIHMIPVNGQLVTPLPFHIGNQVRYAGYDTCHMSLFHHRRVFSDDKVVTNLYRLDYRPL